MNQLISVEITISMWRFIIVQEPSVLVWVSIDWSCGSGEEGSRVGDQFVGKGPRCGGFFPWPREWLSKHECIGKSSIQRSWLITKLGNLVHDGIVNIISIFILAIQTSRYDPCTSYNCHEHSYNWCHDFDSKTGGKKLIITFLLLFLMREQVN